MKNDYRYTQFKFTNQAALTDYEIQIDGVRVIYLSGNIEIGIKLDSRSADKIIRYPKQYISAPFKRLYITTDRKADFSLLIVKPDLVDVGSQECDTDYDLSSTLKRQSFIGFISCSSNPSESRCGIHNPSGSGVLGVVEKIYPLWTGTVWYALLYKQSALFGTVGGQYTNKYLSGVDPLCQLKTYSGAQPNGTRIAAFVSSGLGSFWGRMGGPNENMIKVPIIVPEGYTLWIINEDTFETLNVQFHWTEI
jgi:hypothetical protein